MSHYPALGTATTRRSAGRVGVTLLCLLLGVAVAGRPGAPPGGGGGRQHAPDACAGRPPARAPPPPLALAGRPGGRPARPATPRGGGALGEAGAGVAAGGIEVRGENPAASTDSRTFGPVPGDLMVRSRPLPLLAERTGRVGHRRHGRPCRPIRSAGEQRRQRPPARPRQLHPRAAGHGPAVAAPPVRAGRDLQPLSEPDRAGPAPAVGRDPPADRPGAADLGRDPLRAGGHPRAPRGVERPGAPDPGRSPPLRGAEAGPRADLPVVPPGGRRCHRARRRPRPRAGRTSPPGRLGAACDGWPSSPCTPRPWPSPARATAAG